MKNLWPESFSENTKPSAKTLLEEQARLLPKLTNDVVYAEVKDLAELEAIASSLQNDFAYRFDIRGKFLDKYHFNVLRFSHDITLYPVAFRLDEGIGKELALPKIPARGYSTTVNSPPELEAFIAQVLATDRIKAIVGSILRLSR